MKLQKIEFRCSNCKALFVLGHQILAYRRIDDDGMLHIYSIHAFCEQAFLEKMGAIKGV